ncbi:MAG: zinc ribbon domain-containing protein [Enterocloster sp.]
MIFIGGISQGQKLLDYVKTVICDRCGRYGRYQVMMTYMYFSFFFIPLFKWNKRFYVKMTCCGAVYELDPEVGRAILAGKQVDITQKDMVLVQDGNSRSYFENGTYKTVKKCANCGYETEEDFEFCPKCGRRF